MFDRLMQRAARAGEVRAAQRREALAQSLRAELPGGVTVEAAPDAIRLSGRGLAARFALDPALRWIMARAR